MRCAESLRVQAYFDGELDALSSADVERHAEACAECRELLKDLEQVRSALRQVSSYATTPPALRARIMQALDGESAGPRSLAGKELADWRPRTFWKGAFSALGAAAIAAGFALFFLASPFPIFLPMTW